jgi:hypothetical protein
LQCELSCRYQLSAISYQLLAVEEYGSSGILVPGIDLYRFCSPATVLSKTVLVLSETVLVIENSL